MVNKMKFFHLSVLFITLLLVTSPAQSSTTTSSPKKHVLLLNSYSKGYAWTDNIVKGVEDVLLKRDDVILTVEYMDTKVNNSEVYYQMLSYLYQTKYSNRTFDLIISSDDDAFTFLRLNREELFPKVPVVFCGVNNFTQAKAQDFSLYTGVNEAADFATTLSLMFQLHPNSKNVYVINDQLTTASFLKKEFLTAAEKHKDAHEFIFLEDISMENLLTEVSILSKGSIVFYLSFFKDNTGKTFTPLEAIPLISKAASVPTYGAVDYMLDQGIVGGMLKSSYFQGDTAANLAVKVLNGQDISNLPVILKSPNHYMFDYNQLIHWNINPKQIPEDSIIINEPESTYYKYKKLIWTVTCVLTALVVFIVVLLFNIRKRKRAQKGLQTIITATSSIVDYQSLDNFRNQLVEQLSELLPVKKQMFLFNHDNTNGNDDEILFPSPVSKSDEAGMSTMPKKATQMILESLKQEKCSVSKKNGVAFFKSRYLPGNLMYLKGHKGMDDLDRDLLEIFVNNVTMSIDNIEKHKIEKSLEMAKQIQMSMLPGHFDEFSTQHEVDLHAFLTPAKEVGGDLYDFFAIDKDHLCFVVGDVSGKGIPAALFMAMAKSLIRSAAEGNTNPDQIITKANRGLSRDNDQFMFVTVFLGIYDKNTRELRYTSGGHNPPYIVKSSGEIQKITPHPGIVLGAFEESEYITESIQLNKGDGLYVYSDGVTEAMNNTLELYEEPRLEKALEKTAHSKAKELNNQIILDLEKFVDGAPPSDDITMLFVRV